jgi:hypothetical protein
MRRIDSDASFKAFLRAFGGKWFTGMSGPLTVPFALLALFVDQKYLKALFGILAVLCAGFSSYWVWKTERESVQARQAELNEEQAKQGRPKLTGFFQDFIAHGWTKPGAKDSDNDEPRRTRVMLPPKPTGTLIVLKIGFVNENQTPTTLHNFSLTMKIGDKSFTAKYPEELPELDEWLSPEILAREREAREANLINYLDTSKIAEHGRRIQGTLVFYLDGFMYEDFKGQDWLVTLTITDAWGAKHDVVHWGELPRPSQRIGH